MAVSLGNNAPDMRQIPQISLSKRTKVSFHRPLRDLLLPHDESRENRILRLCFYGLTVALLVLMCLMSRQAGMSGDDTLSYEHAEAVYNYYVYGDREAADGTGEDDPSLMRFHGQSFDNLTYVVNRWLGVDNPYEARHLMNSVVGWLVILVTGLFLVRLCGWRAGILGMILLCLSPRFLGHSLNNPKDIPFALGYVLAIFQIFLFCRELPVIKWRRLVYMALAIALANSVRIGGLVLIPYMFMFVGLWFLFTAPIKRIASWNYWKQALKLIGVLAGVSFVGYMLGLLWWPYALQAPFTNPFKALDLMSDFSIAMRQIFDGKSLLSDSMPVYYHLKYILISTPLAVLAGVLLFLVFSPQAYRRLGPLAMIIMIFSFAFPIIYIMWIKANVYGGWRHVLFTYPFLVMMATVGFESVVVRFRQRWVKIATWSVLGLLLLLPLRHVLRNHPYEYVYFNELIGGTSKAYGRYEMDYYHNSTREASEWVIRNAERNGLETGDKIKVAAFHLASVQYYFRNHLDDFEVVFARWYERDNVDWDYAIFTVTGITPERLLGPHFPPKNTVHTIDVDGKPIAVILRREDKSNLEGFHNFEVGELDTARLYYHKALNNDPYNEVALANMANTFIMQTQADSALLYLDRYMEIEPNRQTQKYIAANIYYIIEDYPRAIAMLDEMIAYNLRFKEAYDLKARIFLVMGDYDMAEDTYERMMDLDILNQTGFDNLIRLYMRNGLTEKSAQNKMFRRLSDTYRKLGDRGKAKLYEGYITQ